MHTVHKFLRGEAYHPDLRLRHDTIVSDPDEKGGIPHDEFEGTHTLIQWLFPTMRPSAHQPNAPVLAQGDVAQMQADPVVTQALLRGNQYMRRFYSGAVGKPLLLQHRNHNHLRITRVIESLSLLHSKELAQEFVGFVCQINAKAGYKVNIASVEFWNNARWYGADMRAKGKVKNAT